MGALDTYRIAFQGMSPGTHSFLYKIDGKFFANFENSPVNQSNVLIDLTFDKQETLFDLHFHISGKVELDCDRCLEPFEQAIDQHFDVFVKFEERTDKMADEDEDVVIISRNDNFVDVSQLIYEFVILSLPSRRVPDKGDCCFGEIILDKEKQEITENIETDPRWASLKKLKSTTDGTSEAKNIEDPQG